MGGAERGERKRKQKQAAKAVKAARTDAGRRGTVAGVIVVVLLALVVGGGVWLQSRNEPGELPPQIPVTGAELEYPVALQGNAIVIGRADAPITIDVYEDFLCPACGQFEQLYGVQLEEAAARGEARVAYHPIAILDAFSEPAGYSTLAAGGAFCAAEAGTFPAYHHTLFDNQPREGGPGWTRGQIEQLGRDLGAGDGFARCLSGADERVSAATGEARQRLSGLRPDGRVGTPTVLVNGKIADTGDTDWLDQALGVVR